MELKLDIALSDLNQVWEQLDDEQLDKIVANLAQLVSEPRKVLAVSWGNGLEDARQYTFSTEIEYEAFMMCLEEIAENMRPIPTDGDETNAFITTTTRKSK